MKFVSWNVNGLRACLKKNFMDSFKFLDADIFAVQETKMQPAQAIIEINGYHQFWNSADKKGYSGTLIFSRIEPLNTTYGIGIDEHDHEGRVITLEFNDFFFVNVYVPNSRQQLERLNYRMQWDDSFRNYLLQLDKLKSVIVCGDFNVAHKEIDLKNPSNNHNSAGFTNEERDKFDLLLNSGFIDTFRSLYPDKVLYTWWSYLRKARENNSGWRIDYFLTSTRMKNQIIDSTIENNIFGSDHCPVTLKVK